MSDKPTKETIEALAAVTLSPKQLETLVEETMQACLAAERGPAHRDYRVGAGESIAVYHDERAGYGGVGWEFHAMAATVCRERDEFAGRLADAGADLNQMRRDLEAHRSLTKELTETNRAISSERDEAQASVVALMDRLGALIADHNALAARLAHAVEVQRLRRLKLHSRLAEAAETIMSLRLDSHRAHARANVAKRMLTIKRELQQQAEGAAAAVTAERDFLSSKLAAANALLRECIADQEWPAGLDERIAEHLGRGE